MPQAALVDWIFFASFIDFALYGQYICIHKDLAWDTVIIPERCPGLQASFVRHRDNVTGKPRSTMKGREIAPEGNKNKEQLFSTDTSHANNG